MTFEDIVKAQEGLKTMPVKGKDYVMVNERVKAFRKLFPEGSIITDIEHLGDGMVVCKASVKVGDNTLATGLAFEKEESSYINKTSYIENCETSAVGRALGFLGIGIDTGIASAEEMANAVTQQTANETINEVKANAFIKMCERDGVHPDKVAQLYKVENVFALTEKMHSNAINHWEQVKEKCK